MADYGNALARYRYTEDPMEVPADLQHPSLASILALMAAGGIAGAPFGGLPGAIAGAGAGGLMAPQIHNMRRRQEQMMDAENQPGGFYGNALARYGR